MGNFRAIAIHLPQFHPIPENDLWWGRGFTEWRNVAKAKSLFPGHEQPRVPADLGHYDLRLPEVREAQAELAQAHGIHGFCYYHYWFHGRRLLERPVNEILASRRPNFPFCLFWANESWSRRWLGEEKEVLIEQTYSKEDDIAHARWLAQAFSDDRYIRVNGRPVFVIYRPTHTPEPEALVERIRRESQRLGVGDPYLVGADARCPNFDLRKIGYDTTLRFEPQLGALPLSSIDEPSPKKLFRNLKRGVFSPKLKVYDYTRARMFMSFNRASHPEIPCVFVGWDNTPRRGENGVIMVNSTPQTFGQELDREVLRRSAETNRSDDLFFINAWNEWAEGNYLEPDLRYGHGFLNEVKRVFGTKSSSFSAAPFEIAAASSQAISSRSQAVG